MNYYVVKYSGPFGFIKPWTAVRDSETFSQQFLTPSIIEGIEKKLFPELLNEFGKIFKIKRYRLNYRGIDIQREKTWSKGGINVYKDKGQYKTNIGILNRGVMLNPNLYLAFENEDDSKVALEQTVFELIFTNSEAGFKVGHNRFNNAAQMYGELKVFGNPIRNQE